MCTLDNTVISFNGTNSFINNSAAGDGGVIYTSVFDTLYASCLLSFNGTNIFTNNSADSAGGAIYTSDNAILRFNGNSNFTNNLAIYGGTIYSFNRIVLSFNGTINFISNSAKIDGGSLYLINSNLSVCPNTTMFWDKNHARYGGAIYVDDQSKPFIYCTQAEISPKECFFQLPGQNLSNGIDVRLVFKNNSADVAGSVLYGGAIDNCKLTHGLDSHSSGEVFDMLVHIEDDNTNSKISSDPFHVCPCESNHTHCNQSVISGTVYPGETYMISVVALGQRDGTVPAVIKTTTNPNSNLLGFQYNQQANNTCTILSYTVFSMYPAHLQLYPDGPCSTLGDKLILYLNLHQNCPPGFIISESARSCVCEPRLEKYTNNCNITNGLGQITRESSQHFWVNWV